MVIYHLQNTFKHILMHISNNQLFIKINIQYIGMINILLKMMLIIYTFKKQ